MFCAGRWRDAERAEVQFMDRMPEAGGWFRSGWLSVLVGQGRAREANSILDELLDAPLGAGDVFRAGTLILAGELAELEARWDQARDLLDQGLALARGTDEQHDSSRGYASAIRVEGRRIESLAGQRAAAEEIERARQVADQRIGQARDLAARLDAAGISLLPEPAAWLRTAEAEHAATHGQDTAQTWADLADTWHTVGQPHPQAVTQYRYADALLRQHGDRDHARRAAAAALEIAERLGAAPLAAEIRQLAQRGRLDLTPPPQPEPDATAATADRLDITPREAEVLALLAAGRTNREIARTLFISDKTASVHVSNLLRKLGAANRAEAAAIAQHMQFHDEPQTQAPGAAD
jgi:DNA-binding CsgD family transcriptional regulator